MIRKSPTKTSPTQRSLKHLRDAGYTVAVVEHWNPFAHIRQDLFGCIDLVAIKPGHTGVLGVQTTTSDHLAARRTKSKAIPALKVWLESGNSFVLHGWKKVGSRWEVRTDELLYDDL